ncbi:AAEL000724-PA [Aedes aegypti]|uniref:Snurportin-1 n=1 Tax=Aedes aegypti TaxID=7159 RepID=Q17NB7_AEDAE|nr:AAEL000724-PB [Aedes aegypti]EAT48219.1 AAEL000724-PA [Aedes aegypti]
MTDSDDSASRFTDLYKNKSRGKEQHQSERRRTLLEEQKRLRQTEVDSSRPGLLELIEAENTESDCSSTDHQQLERRRFRPKVWFSKLYRDKVQLSEWMYEKPDDLENWFLVPCPVGIRCLLVIRKGLAVAYRKDGRSITRFSTRLGKKQRVTVLDCFMTKSRIFYALDLLVYNEMDLVQCECQFRFQWLRSKMEEDNLQKRFCTAMENPWELELIPTMDFKSPGQVEQCLSKYPMFPDTPLDGLLFYHKESNYIYGRTPLVTWLFPFMVPEVLGSEWGHLLNHQYLQKIPDSYQDLGHRAYMDEFDAKLAKKRSRRVNGRICHMEEGEEDGQDELAIWEEMEAIPVEDDGYADDDWQQKELDQIRRLEMEG